MACRNVHVTELTVRGGDASPGTDRDVGAVAAFLPRRESFELFARRFAKGVFPVVDVAGGGRELAGEPGARIERAVGADGVRVLHVHVARAVVHASCVLKPWRCVSSRRNDILSSRKSQLSHPAPAPEPTDVMHVPLSGFAFALTSVRGITFLGCVLASARTIGLKLTFTSLSAKS